MDEYFKRKRALDNYLQCCVNVDMTHDQRYKSQEVEIRELREKIMDLETKLAVKSWRLLNQSDNTSIMRLHTQLEEKDEYIEELKEEIGELDTFININFHQRQASKHRLRIPVAPSPESSAPYVPEHISFFFDNQTKTKLETPNQEDTIVKPKPI